MPSRSQLFCIVCGGADVVGLIQLISVPVICTQLWRSASEARKVARADIDLVGCRGCGHVFNAVFDPARITYEANYENSLMASPRYRQFTDAIIERLFAAYDLKGRTVVEIGCGRGEFRHILCQRGIRTGIGFEPSRPSETVSVDGAMMRFISSVFDPALAPHADAVCTRHVLEHLPRPVDLLRAIRKAYASCPAQVLFIEVPNGGFMLDQLGIWEFLYEELSYFTPSSLANMLRLAGLGIERIEPAFGGYLLIAEAICGPHDARHPASSPAVAENFHTFGARYTATVTAWREWMDLARRQGKRLALWGGGSKGITFLNLLDRNGQHVVQHVIDINPLKTGTFTAGTGHQIVPPAALKDSPPDAILLMNPEYETEVRRALRDLNIAVQLIPVSGYLPPPATA
ncbi:MULTISPECIES: class I SAM-dependent methyltransferase [unclassified Inquilinus]|uniref:class I SAM-dependent methyltransferase n=1 Tax=unclassified Inquilinus TaxID=2645927 RepID=UPI003F8FA9DF